MQQVEVEIFHAALFQLIFKDGGGIVGSGNLVAGIFIGQIEALPGIVFKDLTDDPLGVSLMIGVGGVEVVDAVGNGVGGHLRHLLLIDGDAVTQQGQTHGAKAQHRQLLILKLLVDHDRILPLFPVPADEADLTHVVTPGNGGGQGWFAAEVPGDAAVTAHGVITLLLHQL